jgi:hypothetical protein
MFSNFSPKIVSLLRKGGKIWYKQADRQARGDVMWCRRDAICVQNNKGKEYRHTRNI